MNIEQSRDSFAGRVVIVTGASAGLGQAYAEELARLGAHVVVNGRTRDNVEKVVHGIHAAGGTAVACVADVVDGDWIAQCALDSFGQIDALIANAGIVRDRTFVKMGIDEWRDVIRTHLDGAFACVKAVWPHMQSRQYGRIVLTSSGAGFHGNFGQTNYATAKAGVIGMAKSLAIEGKKYGIVVNAFAPMALTQMNDGIFDEAMKKNLSVARVAPFAVALCHERMLDSGMTIEAGGGWAAALRWQRSAGLAFDDENLSAAAVLDQWSRLTQFDQHADYPETTADSLSAAVAGLERPGARPSPSN